MRRLLLTFLCCFVPAASAGEVHIAVASNFKQTALAINTQFEKETRHLVKLSSASTGVLHSQILHGAPFDIFLAADSQSPEALEAAGYVAPGKRFCYARGLLALAGAKDSLDDLQNPDISLAIANPATAPYGRAALEVLNRPEYTAAKKRKLVRANNVVQAYQYWYSASVDRALVALSLLPHEAVPIPQSWYTPINQQATL
ncbi:MAG: molybdate ABC transporter substrate-binding protein, partial [Halioglobus sp.]